MITKKTTYLVFTLFFLGFAILAGCQKDKNSVNDGKTKVEIRMTDAPGNFDEINLNIKEIILISDDGSFTFDVEVDPFNILDYRIGTNQPDILVATGEMPSGEIREIRLVLNDSGNTIVVDGVQQNLTTPSGQSSGWKVKLKENPSLIPDVTYTLLLDFDAAQSIVSTGNGKYLLKPVVRGITAPTSGLISGTVLPLSSHPEVLVISGVDTIGTIADPLTGKFTVGGLYEGSYSVLFLPTEGFKETKITDVDVILGQNTDLGIITLEE
jgi:hypothetical protein